MMFETIKEYYRKKLFTDEDMFIQPAAADTEAQPA